LAWIIDDDSAWYKVDSQTYRHYSGISLAKRGKLWSANTTAGTLISKHQTALDAIIALEKGDSSFWTFGQSPSITYRGFSHKYRPFIGRGDKDEVFTFYFPSDQEFPESLRSLIEKYFSGKAKCAGCLSLMSNYQIQTIPQFDGCPADQILHLTCTCGHPVWQMEITAYFSAQTMMQKREIEWRRMQRIKAAGGKHSVQEIQEIVALQEGRCIYCDVKFTEELRPTKDHLCPTTYGGGDWALNIIAACRSCNSRRGDIPFRTFCKLLSSSQNQKILMHLNRRLLGIDRTSLTEEALISFQVALALHEPKHYRYLAIMEMRSTARRNASKNRLLPYSLKAIFNRAHKIQSAEANKKIEKIKQKGSKVGLTRPKASRKSRNTYQEVGEANQTF
jgi:5-methylcytosine-specific restriction endonuclease McrA